jgi:hypothetical protein
MTAISKVAKNYFAGTKERCGTGALIMGKDSDGRIVPIEVSQNGKMQVAGGDNYIKSSVQFGIATAPGSGNYGANAIISQYDETDPNAIFQVFNGVGLSGLIYGAKLIVGITGTGRTYALDLYQSQATTGNNNSSTTLPNLFNANYIGSIDFFQQIINGTNTVALEAYLANPLGFISSGGQIFGILRIVSGTLARTPGIQFKIDLDILGT